MSYYLSKILGPLLIPGHVAMLLVGLGLLLAFVSRTARLGRWLAVTGFLALLALGLGPAGYILIYPLEERFAATPPPSQQDKLTGIIMLGGFESGRISAARPGLSVNEAAERLTEGVRIAIAHPEARLVFTGGAATVFMSAVSGAGAVGEWLKAVGIPPERLVLEGQSRTTYENAILTRDLVKPKPGDRWLLVTSAAHMPRSVGVFRKAGFEVVPYPVDYRTAGAGDLLRPAASMGEGLYRVEAASREWLGLLAYWLQGRTSALWPGP